MLQNRVIPVLTIQNNILVKTYKFSKSKYIGDPLNAVRIFNDKEVDEILLIDISATKNNKSPNFELIENISSQCLMPLTYGGGINTISDARRIFSIGVEKISLQRAAFKNPKFIRQLSEIFGKQSIILSVDIKRSFLNKPKIFNYLNGKKSSNNWIETIQELISFGVGEVLLNAVDKDGVLKGPDLELIDLLSDKIDVPLIALGGISGFKDMKDVINVGASAVAAGSFFSFYGPHKAVLLTYPKPSEIENLFR